MAFAVFGGSCRPCGDVPIVPAMPPAALRLFGVPPLATLPEEPGDAACDADVACVAALAKVAGAAAGGGTGIGGGFGGEENNAPISGSFRGYDVITTL